MELYTCSVRKFNGVANIVVLIVLFFHYSNAFFSFFHQPSYHAFNDYNTVSRQVSSILSISSSSFTLYGSSDSESVNGVRIAIDRDIPRIAELLSYALYTPADPTIENIPLSQRKELARLEVEDLTLRYGSRGKFQKTAYPSALLLYEQNNQVVGYFMSHSLIYDNRSVGLDCQIYSKSPETESRFTKIKRNPQSIKSDEEVVVVLANLCVRPDVRKQGIAKTMLQKCYELVKQWEYNSIYLLVDETNTKAIKLYKSQGFQPVFRDEEATCVVYGTYNLKTAPCVNICFRKTLSSSVNSFQSGFLSSFFK